MPIDWLCGQQKGLFFRLSLSSDPVEVFRVFHEVLTASPINGALVQSKTHCNLYASNFEDGITYFRSRLDTVVSAAPVEVSDAPICPIANCALFWTETAQLQ